MYQDLLAVMSFRLIFANMGVARGVFISREFGLLIQCGLCLLEH